MSEQKKFCVVIFPNDNNVEVIPSSWLRGENLVPGQLGTSQAMWPNSTSTSIVSRFISVCKAPEDSWRICDVIIKCYCRTLNRANFRANKLMESSCPGSDSSESDDETTRKKKIPRRFLSSSDEDITLCRGKRQKTQENSDVPPLKKYTIPHYPSPRLDISRTNRMDLGEDLSENYSQSLLTPIRPNLFKKSVPDNSNCNPGNKVSEIFSMCHRIFTSIGKMERDIKSIQREQESIKLLVANKLLEDKSENKPSYLYKLPDGLELPLTSDEDLQALNRKLGEEDNLSLILIRYFQGSMSGKTESVFILNVTKKILTREVAMLYSRLGRKGKKSFEDLSAVYNVILAAASARFPNSRREDLAEKFGKVLSTSGDWDGRGVERRKRNPENFENSLFTSDVCEF